MNLWTIWLDALHDVLEHLSSLGLGAGLGIVALTLILRTALLPMTSSIAYRTAIRHKKRQRMQKELEALKERFGAEPHIYAQQITALYRRHDLAVFDGKGVFGGLLQMPIWLGMFQVLRDGTAAVRFLWAQSLTRPDLWFALLAGVTTAMAAAVNPDLPQSIRLALIVIPGVLAVLFALKWSSGLALYWSVSNCFTTVQTLVVHRLIARRIRSGALKF